MEKIILKNVQDLVQEKSTSPMSTERPRTDWRKTYRESVRFNLSATFQKTNIFVQQNAEHLYASECWYSVHGKPHERVDTETRASSITSVMTLLPGDKYTTSSRLLVSVDRCALLLLQDEQPEVTNCDKLGSCSLDNAGGEVPKFHTVPDAAPDTSSHPDCKLLLETLEGEPPGGCNLPDGNGDEGAKAQCSVGQIKAFNPTSGDEELRCQQGYAQNDTIFCDVWSQSAEPCVQKREYDSATTFLRDYLNTTSFNPNVVGRHSEKLDQGKKKEWKTFELQICENEEVAVFKTKAQANENSRNKNVIHCEAECAEGSTVDNDVVSSRHIVTANGNIEADVLSGAKGERAAGEMIAKAPREMADHTAESPVPPRISQEAAEADNDVRPFSVIDPAIWSETDREAVRGRGSQCNAGAELKNESPSLAVSEIKTPSSLFDVTPPQEALFLGQTRQFKHSRGTQQCDDEKEGWGQTNAAHLKTGNKGDFLWNACRSSRPKCPPGQDKIEENIQTAGSRIKERNLSGCSQDNLGNLKAQMFHNLESETLKKDGSTKIKTEDGASVGCETTVIRKDGLQQENQTQAATLQVIPDCFSECSERDVSDSSRVLASTLPTHWDAVVPETQEVNPSYHAITIAPAPNCSDTLYPVPSVFAFGDRVPAGFDTFQRIQLPLEDDDEKVESGSNSPLCTSPSQWKQRSRSILEAESTNQHEVASEEEEEGKDVKRFKCHTENTTNLSSDCSCQDMAKLTTTPVRWPEQHVTSRSAVASSDNDCGPASSLKEDIEFDMKKHFDVVLKELRLYFEISVSEFFGVGNGSVPEQSGDVTKVPEEETSQQFFSPNLMHHKNTASGKFKQALTSQRSA